GPGLVQPVDTLAAQAVGDSRRVTVALVQRVPGFRAGVGRNGVRHGAHGAKAARETLGLQGLAIASLRGRNTVDENVIEGDPPVIGRLKLTEADSNVGLVRRLGRDIEIEAAEIAVSVRDVRSWRRG